MGRFRWQAQKGKTEQELDEMLREQIKRSDIEALSNFVDLCQVRGFSYKEIFEKANEVSRVSPAEWEDLLYEME